MRTTHISKVLRYRETGLGAYHGLTNEAGDSRVYHDMRAPNTLRYRQLGSFGVISQNRLLIQPRYEQTKALGHLRSSKPDRDLRMASE